MDNLQPTVQLFELITIQSRLQTMQIAGFVLAGVAIVALFNAKYRGQLSPLNRTLCYAAMTMIFISFGLGLYPDIRAIYIKLAIFNDLSLGIMVVGKQQLQLYLAQLVTGCIAIFLVACTRVTNSIETQHETASL